MEGNSSSKVNKSKELPDKLTDRVEALVSSGNLTTKAKITLLIFLCDVYKSLLPEKAEQFWKLLVPLRRVIPPEQKEPFNNLSQFFDQSESPSKGIVAQTKAAIKAIKEGNNLTETKTRIYLESLEEKVYKCALPFGKKSALAEIADAWIPIDRLHSLTLLKKLSKDQQTNLVRSINQQVSLTPDESAALALGEIGDESAIKPLIATLKDYSREVKNAF